MEIFSRPQEILGDICFSEQIPVFYRKQSLGAPAKSQLKSANLIDPSLLGEICFSEQVPVFYRKQSLGAPAKSQLKSAKLIDPSLKKANI